MKVEISHLANSIKEQSKHVALFETLIAFRAITVHETGEAYDAIATSQLLPKHLVEILDLPVENCSLKDSELRISLKIESLWILTNLSLIDGFNQRLFRDHNIQELIQGLILEHFTFPFVDCQLTTPNK